MKKLLTLVLCWLLAFEAFGATTFKAKTAASGAGGSVTSLNKVDGSFEDGSTQWSASVGTITATASTEFQGNYKGVWSGTGTGTLDLQWTATASNTFEASMQFRSPVADSDHYVCAVVNGVETGCKLVDGPDYTVNTIRKISVVANSVMSSSFYLRLKHTGSDTFSVDVDDGKIEPWTPQAVNLTKIENAIYYGNAGQAMTADVSDIPFSTQYSSTLSDLGSFSGTIYTAKINQTLTISAKAAWQSETAGTLQIFKNGVNADLLGEYSTNSTNTISKTLKLSAGDYVSLRSTTPRSVNNVSYHRISITATAISDNVVQSWQPSGSLGELKFLPQNIAPQGFIPALGSSIGKTAGTYQGDAYYDLYKVLWTQASVTAGEPYVISSAKGTDAATDWAANKTITIDVSGLVVRAFKSGTTAAVGAKQADAFQGHVHDILTNGSGGGAPGSAIEGVPNTGTFVLNNDSWAVGNPKTDGTNGTPRTASETRMTNIAQYAFIRYGNDAPTLYALPTRSEVFSANVAASGTVTNATQNFVTSCTNTSPSVCSLWSNFGVAPICWAHTTDITKRAEVSSSTATTTTVARTDTGTAFNLFCHLK